MASHPPPSVDWAKLVDLYVKARDRIAEIDAQAAKDKAPYQAAMEQLDGLMLAHLSNGNTDSAKTAAGTFFRKKKESVTVADKGQFREWLQQDFASRADYADIRAAKVNILKFKQDTTTEMQPGGALPPGINYYAEWEVQVRRASDKAKGE